MTDIQDKSDVKILVDAFYQEVRKDGLIGPVFATIVPNDQWPKHLERMYSFWNTVLFGVRDYQGNPFSKHRDLPLEQRHFDRWLHLFSQTIDVHFQGEKAEEAKLRAHKMGQLFESKLAFIRREKRFKNLF